MLRVAEPDITVARVHTHTVGFEVIEPVFDFTQAAVDVGKGQHDKHAEPWCMVGNKSCHVFVAFADDTARLRLAP